MNYDIAAKTWDDQSRIMRAKKISGEIIKHIPSDKKTAMEFGCGTGLISFNFTDRFQNIVLIDSSQGMIDVLVEKINQSHAKNMIPIMIDLTKDRYHDQTFDVIYSSMALHHIININEIISTLFGLLNRGGCICFVDLDKDDGSFHLNEPLFDGHNGFEKDEISNAFLKAGFLNVSIETFYQDAKDIGDKKIPYSLFCLYAEKS